MASKSFFCIDGHTCGNPVRLVAGGGPLLRGANMSERRQDFLQNWDWIRRALMFEPRGHDVMSGSILYPPTTPDADIGVLFIERAMRPDEDNTLSFGGRPSSTCSSGDSIAIGGRASDMP